MEAHLTLVALLRSRLRVPGLGPVGERPLLADRLSKVAWSFAHRVRKAAEPGASAHLADDDIMLLCQGSEVLEALTECGHEFFEGLEKRESGSITEVKNVLVGRGAGVLLDIMHGGSRTTVGGRGGVRYFCLRVWGWRGGSNDRRCWIL